MKQRKRTISYEGKRSEICSVIVTLFKGIFRLTERECNVLTMIIEDNGATDKKTLMERIEKKLKISRSNVAQQFTSLVQKKAITKSKDEAEPSKHFVIPADLESLDIIFSLKIKQ